MCTCFLFAFCYCYFILACDESTVSQLKGCVFLKVEESPTFLKTQEICTAPGAKNSTLLKCVGSLNKSMLIIYYYINLITVKHYH